jgi:hypothetical protein
MNYIHIYEKRGFITKTTMMAALSIDDIADDIQ